MSDMDEILDAAFSAVFGDRYPPQEPREAERVLSHREIISAERTRIAKRMVGSGMTQVEAAEFIGVTPNLVWHMVHGHLAGKASHLVESME